MPIFGDLLLGRRKIYLGNKCKRHPCGCLLQKGGKKSLTTCEKRNTLSLPGTLHIAPYVEPGYKSSLRDLTDLKCPDDREDGISDLFGRFVCTGDITGSLEWHVSEYNQLQSVATFTTLNTIDQPCPDLRGQKVSLSFNSFSLDCHLDNVVKLLAWYLDRGCSQIIPVDCHSRKICIFLQPELSDRLDIHLLMEARTL